MKLMMGRLGLVTDWRLYEHR